jgi:hypothetical protein
MESNKARRPEVGKFLLRSYISVAAINGGAYIYHHAISPHPRFQDYQVFLRDTEFSVIAGITAVAGITLIKKLIRDEKREEWGKVCKESFKKLMKPLKIREFLGNGYVLGGIVTTVRYLDQINKLPPYLMTTQTFLKDLEVGAVAGIVSATGMILIGKLFNEEKREKLSKIWQFAKRSYFYGSLATIGLYAHQLVEFSQRLNQVTPQLFSWDLVEGAAAGIVAATGITLIGKLISKEKRSEGRTNGTSEDYNKSSTFGDKISVGVVAIMFSPVIIPMTLYKWINGEYRVQNKK